MTIQFRYQMALTVSQNGQEHLRTFFPGERIVINALVIHREYTYLTFIDGVILALAEDYVILL